MRKLLILCFVALIGGSASGSLQGQPGLKEALLQQTPGIDPQVLDLALRSYAQAEQEGILERKGILTVIDYSKLSSEKRLWTFDLQSRRILFEDLVAHGKNSGENKTIAVSNDFESKMSSVGVYKTGEPYIGKNGYSLRLIGLENGFNTNAFARAVVLHGAWYVSDEMIKTYGRIGRSWGCPAVRKEIATPLIDTIKDGSLLVIYYPDTDWLEHSAFLHASLKK